MRCIRIHLLIFFLFIFSSAIAQTTQWGLKIGGTGTDLGNVTKVAPNGNVYVAGSFSGTTDLDPSAGIYNIVSSGNEDMFLACYTPAGSFLWGFKLGGIHGDEIVELAFDAQNNVYIVGWFRDIVDFDPSASGTANLTENNTTWGGGSWGGDGFLAKYNVSGQYQWAFQIGGTTQYDAVECVQTDPQGNVYIGGTFLANADLDPLGSGFAVNGGGGRSYIAKYTTNGSMIWGFNFLSQGGGGVDCGVRSMILRGSDIYVCGFVEFYSDFDPSAGVAAYTNPGSLGDPYVARYDTAGNYIAHATGTGTDFEEAQQLTLDPAGNVYITGGTSNTTNLNFGSNVLNAQGSSDMFVVKFSGNLAYQWGHMIGGSGADRGNCITYIDGSIFCGGGFSGTVDFDPSFTTNSLVSSGNKDIYVAEYDLNGNYICAFKVGSNGYDGAFSIAADGQNSFYVTGAFTNAPDFDPTPATYSLSSTDQSAFLVKYIPGTQGNIIASGDTICPFEVPYVTITDTTSGGTFSVVVNDGFNNYTYPNVQSGVAFPLTPIPTTTTSYTVSVPMQSVCGTSGSTATFTIQVKAAPVANAGPDVQVCNNSFVQLNGTGGITYSWMPSSVLNNPNIANPTMTVPDTTITFTMVTTNPVGCSDTDQVTISTHQPPVANAGNNATICAGASSQLQGTGGGTYNWYPATGLNNPNIANPVFSGTSTSNINLVVTNQYNCSDTDQVTITVNPAPNANAGADITECSLVLAQLNGSGGGAYNWSPASVLNASNIANPTMTITDTTILFTLIVTNGFNCSDTDQVNVSVHSGIALANAGPDSSVCPGMPIQLQGSGNGSYQWYPATGLNDPNIPDPTFTGNNMATFNLIVTDQYGCTDTDQVIISMYPVPNADAGQDMAACNGGSIQLQGTGGNSYDWYPQTGMTGSNTATPTVVITGPITYYMIATNNEGCSDTDAVTVSVIPAPLFTVSPQQNVCISDSVKIYAGGGNSYSWYPNEHISSTNGDTVSVWPENDMIYYVVVTEPTCGYMDTMSVSIDVKALPNVNIDKADPIGCSKPNGQLSASGAVTYQWTPGNTLTNVNISSPMSFAQVPTWYTVMGTDEYGCIAYDSALVDVIKDNMNGFYIPTAFSPNGDGKNDCYKILLPPGISEFELYIYNRFGNKVFEADDASDCWDGRYKGNMCDVGTYFYYYSMKSDACKIVKEGKGDLTLVR